MRETQNEHERTQQKLAGILKKPKLPFFESNICLESMRRSSTDPFLQEKPSRSSYPDSQIQPNHFQKPTDILRFISNN
jgi:hypothetical protein